MKGAQTAVRVPDLSMFDPDAELMPREALTALQTSRLQQTLQRAYADVPHYRSKWDAAGSSSRAIQVTRRYRALSLHVQV